MSVPSWSKCPAQNRNIDARRAYSEILQEHLKSRACHSELPALAHSADCGIVLERPNRMRCCISSKRPSAFFSRVSNDTAIATANDSGMLMMAGLRNDTNHQAPLTCASGLPSTSTWIVGDSA